MEPNNSIFDPATVLKEYLQSIDSADLLGLCVGLLENKAQNNQDATSVGNNHLLNPISEEITKISSKVIHLEGLCQSNVSRIKSLEDELQKEKEKNASLQARTCTLEANEEMMRKEIETLLNRHVEGKAILFYLL